MSAFASGQAALWIGIEDCPPGLATRLLLLAMDQHADTTWRQLNARPRQRLSMRLALTQLAPCTSADLNLR